MGFNPLKILTYRYLHDIIKKKDGDPMNLKHLMNKALTDLLEENEKILFPIYGSLCRGKDVQDGFFAFTERNLLIALLDGETVAETMVIPLDISSCAVSQEKISKQYTVDIRFNERKPLKIRTQKKISDIDTQEKNFSSFLDHLSSISPKQTGFVLDDIAGERIRWQFFTIYLYTFTALSPTVVFYVPFLEGKDGLFSVSFFFEALLMMSLMISVCFILSFFNKHYFGKVVCVMNEKGLYTEDRFVSWDRVKAIGYNAHASLSSQTPYNHASFDISCEDVSIFLFDVPHFPLYGLGVAKKYAPHAEIYFSVYQKLYCCACFIPTVITVILIILKLFKII